MFLTLVVRPHVLAIRDMLLIVRIGCDGLALFMFLAFELEFIDLTEHYSVHQGIGLPTASLRALHIVLGDAGLAVERFAGGALNRVEHTAGAYDALEFIGELIGTKVVLGGVKVQHLGGRVCSCSLHLY